MNILTCEVNIIIYDSYAGRRHAGGARANTYGRRITKSFISLSDATRFQAMVALLVFSKDGEFAHKLHPTLPHCGAAKWSKQTRYPRRRRRSAISSEHPTERWRPALHTKTSGG